MVTPAIFIALLGTIHLEPAISAAISSEPIQITVNENFNAHPGQAYREFQSLEPGVIHQGANFYFKPKFTLPSSSVPHHIKALISLIQQHHSCSQDATKEIFENKLMEILKPFMYAKETMTDIVLEEENSSKTAKPSSILITEEPKPATPELLVIPEAPALPPLSFNGVPPLVEEELKKEELETKSIPEEPIVIEIKAKPAVSELVFIPEAPVLPPFSADEMRIVEEVKIEELKKVPESIVVDIESKPATPELLVIPEAPVLPPLSFNDISAFVEEEVKKEESVILEKVKGVSEEPIVIEVEGKPVTPDHLIIPKAPVLPPLSYADVSEFVEEGIKKEESAILEKAQGVSEEPIVIEIESKPATPELLVVPEAPVLAPLSFNDISAFVQKEVKKEESVILEKVKGVSEEPIVIEVEGKPVTPEHLIIPKAPVLPPLSYADVSEFVEEGIKKEESAILEKAQGVSEEPIVIEIESKPATPELLVVPEAPVLAPLSFNDISAFVQKEVKKEESVILEKVKGVSEEPIVIEVEGKPVTPEHLIIPKAPVLPPLSYADVSEFVEEGIKKEESAILEKAQGVSEEPIVIEIESKPATPELLVIPEAPVLAPLSFNDISAFVEEEVKKEESLIVEKVKGVSEEPIVIEVEPKPATPELFIIPEAPMLPPLSFDAISAFVQEEVKKEESVILEGTKGVSEEPIVIEVEAKPVTPEHLVIPEASLLHPLSYAKVSEFVEEGIKKDESVILEKAQGVSEEPIVIEIESKPATPELFIIPEAPMLPPLTFDDISAFVQEEVKKEESALLEETKGVSEEPIVIEIESKPATPEFFIIPEAPMLPPLSFDNISAFVQEEVKKEESVLLEETKGVSEEPIVIEIESKPATPKLLVIPEAPVLPPLSYNDISAFVEEEVKKEESIILAKAQGVSEEPIVIEVERKPVTPEHLVIPEAPVLPPVSYNDVSAFVEEGIKKEESVILQKAQGVSEEPIVIEIESKPVTPELIVIPEAPVLPPLSFNDITAFVEEEVKKEESVILEKAQGVSEEPIVIEIESKPATPELFIIPEAPMLPPLSFDDISAFVQEEVKKEESVLLEETKGVSEEPIVIEIESKPVTPELLVIPEAPVLPPLSFNDITAFVEEEVKKEESVILEKAQGVSEEPIVIEIESKPATPELFIIPEAPMLPPLSFDNISAFVQEEVKKEESVLLEETKGVSEEPIVIEIESKPATPELLVIPEAPVLAPLSYNDISAFVEEEVKKEESIILAKAQGVSEEPIVIEVERKPVTPEHLVIPEAPVLPPLSYNDVTAFVEEGIKREESVILQKAQGVSEEPIVIEIESKPVTPELIVIPEAPVLPPLSYNDVTAFVEEEVKKEESVILEKAQGVSEEPIVIEIESKPATPELFIIPEAPMLPPLSFDDISAFVQEEVKKEESVLLEETKGVSEEPIVIEIESKPVTPELLVIPEAPMLTPLSFNDISAFVHEEVKKEESVKLEEKKGVSEEPIVIEIESKPVTPEHLVIPEAPVLPPLSYNDVSEFVEEGIIKEKSVILEKAKGVSEEPIVIEVERKPVTLEHLVIPEAPILPPLSYADVSELVEEGIKKEESVILEKAQGLSEEPIVIEIDSKPTPELLVIPEAPVLPPLSFNDITPFVEEEVKKEELVILEETKGVSEEPIVIEVDRKPVTLEHLVIPEAPVLPPLSYNDVSAFVEQGIKKEESVKLEKAQGVSEEPIVIEIESKHPEHLVIPEAPVLPPLSYNDVSEFVEEGIIKEKSVILEKAQGVSEELTVIEVEPKHVIPEHVVIPEAPVLPPLSFNALSSIVEDEVKKEKSVLLKESTGVFPSISDQESVIVNVEPKPAIQKLVIIPEAPLSPPMSDIVAIKEVKSEESIISEEFTGRISETSARPTSFVETETVESYAVEDNKFPVAAEELKIEIPILLEESIEVFPPTVSSRPSLQEHKMSNSYVLEKDSQPNSERFLKKTFPPTIIRPSKPSNNLGLFSYAPFLSHLSNHAPKTKQVMFPKPASLERFLLKKRPLRLPVTPFPKLPLNAENSPFLENANQFLYPTAYAHDVVEKRIAPNMAFKNNAPPKRVKILIRSKVPKGSS